MMNQPFKIFIKFFCLYCIMSFFYGCTSTAMQVPHQSDRLVSTDQTHKQPAIDSSDSSCELMETRPRPSWIDHPPQKAHYLFGVGIAPKQNPAMQRRAAEILAKEDIAKQIQTYVSSQIEIIDTNDQGNSHTQINTRLTEMTQMLLHGVVIEDRWNDRERCDSYALASVRLNTSEMSNDADSGNQTYDDQMNQGINFKKQGIVYGIQSEGACAIHGMTSRQAQTIALQRARASAIQKACGNEITSSRVVTHGKLVLDFIQSYSKGYIIREADHWQPIREYQTSPTSPPEIEYNVSIDVDVYIPQKRLNTIGLQAQLNKTVFIKGERAILTINARKSCQVGIFNIQANDTVMMLHPHPYRPSSSLIPNHAFVIDNLFPEPLEGEERNIEAIFIVGVLTNSAIDFYSLFSIDQALDFSEFFKRYAGISDQCVDMILPYEVMAIPLT